MLLPYTTHAAVHINEVAWMGNSETANDEWIELYNDGSSDVSVDGWILRDGMNLEIGLAGTVGAGEYAVLERTDDTSAPGSAFLIYTGALTNTGAVLTLERSDGSIEDQVAGGENWQNIGGDNTTKETAQYTTGGWITGTPTPQKSNVGFTPVVESDDSDDTADVSEEKTVTSRSSSKSSKKQVLTLPDWELEAEITAPKFAYVNQPVSFSVEPSGLSELLLKSVQFSWNFGDLTEGTGREVTHRYSYPGTYVMFIGATFKRHSASVRHEITILPVSFSMTKNTDGDIQVHNNAKYEVDVSGYSVRSDTTIVFPQNTILLPNATLTIARERLGQTSYVWLLDQKNIIVASTLPEIPAQEQRTVAYVPSAPPIPSTVVAAESPVTNFAFASEEEIASEIGNPDDFLPNETPAPATQNVAALYEAHESIPKEKIPYFGLIGLLSLGILAVYATRIT